MRCLPDFPAPARPLRIAVVTETFPPEVNGVAMTIGRMVDGLHARGHRIQLSRPRQSDADAPCRSGRFEEILLPGLGLPRYPGLRFGLPARGELIRRWTAQRPDVVHVITEGPLGWSALAAARRLGLPVATNFHTNFHQYGRHYGIGWLSRPILHYLRRFHNRAQLTMVPTQALRDTLERLGYRHLSVVARGIDTTLFHPQRRDAGLRSQWGLAPGERAVLVVGRLAAEKNLELACQAFQAMRRLRPGWKLIFVGDGPERARLQARCPDALFAGVQRGEALARHYASGDVFLFPSLTETYGNVTLEAMASGLTVLAFDDAAAHEHIRSGWDGLLAPRADAGAFIELATGLARDPEPIGRLGAAAAAVAARLGWDRVHDALEEHLRLVVTAWENGNDAPAPRV